MKFLYTGTNVVIYLGGKPVTCANTHPNFEKIVKALNDDSSETAIKQLIDMKEAIMKEVPKEVSNNVEFKDGIVYYKGTPVPQTVSSRINGMVKLGFNIVPMLNFVDNLYDNPSYRATQELLGFLECNELPITEDGYFLSYKKVRNNYMDIFSGTFDNSIGQVCEMPRNQVNENQNQTCSQGLHFASYSYMAVFGDQGDGASDRLMVLKINPKDVVAIPTDYNNAKGRCCKYIVVDEIKNDGIEEIPDNFIPGYKDENNGIVDKPTTSSDSEFNRDNYECDFDECPECGAVNRWDGESCMKCDFELDDEYIKENCEFIGEKEETEKELPQERAFNSMEEVVSTLKNVLNHFTLNVNEFDCSKRFKENYRNELTIDEKIKFIKKDYRAGNLNLSQLLKQTGIISTINFVEEKPTKKPTIIIEDRDGEVGLTNQSDTYVSDWVKSQSKKLIRIKKHLIHKYVKRFGSTPIVLTEIANVDLRKAIETGTPLDDSEPETFMNDVKIHKKIGNAISEKLKNREITYEQVYNYLPGLDIAKKYKADNDYKRCGKVISKWLEVNNNTETVGRILKEAFGLEL